MKNQYIPLLIVIAFILGSFFGAKLTNAKLTRFQAQQQQAK